jgi:hypothetical protein
MFGAAAIVTGDALQKKKRKKKKNLRYSARRPFVTGDGPRQHHRTLL